MGSRSHRQLVWVAVVLLLLGYALRAYRLDYQSLWRDEVDSVRFATRSLPALLSTFRTPGENGPLYFLLLRGWLTLAGRSEFALRYLSLIGGVLAIPLAAALGRRLAGRKLAILSALLVATSPYLIWYSQEGKMYGLLLSLVLAALCALWDGMTRPGWGAWVLCWALTTLAIYVHLLAVLLIAVEVGWFVVMCVVRPATRRRLVPMSAMLAMLTLPYLPLVRWQVILWQSEPFQTGHSFVPLGTMATTLLAGLSRGVRPMPALWSLVPFVFLLLAGLLLWQPQRQADAVVRDEQSPGLRQPSTTDAAQSLRPSGGQALPLEAKLLLLTWLIVPPLLLFFISMRKPLFTDRYLIWVAPAFYVLLGAGVLEVRRRWKLLAGALLALLLVLNLQAVWYQSHTKIKADMRSAVQYVENLREPNDLLLFLMPYVRHTYTYYSQGIKPWADPPYSNAGATSNEVAEQLAEITEGYQTVWLVESEPEMWDRRGLTARWLDEQSTHSDEAHFTLVDVTRYELQAP